MNTLQEIEAVRKRMIQEINTEFDILTEHLSEAEGVGKLKKLCGYLTTGAIWSRLSFR